MQELVVKGTCVGMDGVDINAKLGVFSAKHARNAFLKEKERFLKIVAYQLIRQLISWNICERDVELEGQDD